MFFTFFFFFSSWCFFQFLLKWALFQTLHANIVNTLLTLCKSCFPPFYFFSSFFSICCFSQFLKNLHKTLQHSKHSVNTLKHSFLTLLKHSLNRFEPFYLRWHGWPSILLYVNDQNFKYFTAYRCCYCHYWNPARKQRPTAPKLETSPVLRRQQSTDSSSTGSEGLF